MFILTECIDRELGAAAFPTHEQAWSAMKESLLGLGTDVTKDYDKEKDENGFVKGSDNYAITEDTAWLDGTLWSGNELHCNWKIVEIPFQ